jgi:hypothetical protein
MLNPTTIPTTSDYLWLEPALRTWIVYWREQFKDALTRDSTPSSQNTISEHIQKFIDMCTECGKADPIVAVPIDVSWVEVAFGG